MREWQHPPCVFMVFPEELCSQYQELPLADARHLSLGPAEESHSKQEEEGKQGWGIPGSH